MDSDESVRLCGTNSRGTTLRQLVTAAKTLGLHAYPVKIGLGELATLKTTAIISLWNEHYAVVEPVYEESQGVAFAVTDPPHETKRLDEERLARLYAGYALVLSRTELKLPPSAPATPDIRFDESVYDFGFVDEGGVLTHDFVMRNVGDADLIIAEAKSSCGCSTVVLPHSVLRPGQKQELQLIVDTAQRLGAEAFGVTVRSNDPVVPAARVRLVGGVRSKRLVRVPYAVDFGGLRRGTTPTRTIIVPTSEERSRNYSDVKLEIKRVITDNPHVIAELAPDSPDAPGVHSIRTSMDAHPPLGLFRAKVIVESTHPLEPRAEVPVTAMIRGNVDLNRESFFLGLAKKGEERKAPVTISTVSKDPLKIESVESSLECVTVEVAPKTEGNEYTLTATLKPDAPLGNIRGEVTIHTNDPDQPEMKVPIYAYVEEGSSPTDS